MRFKLTGARGDIGSQIESSLLNLGYEVSELDFSEQCEKNDVVIHLAAKHPFHSASELVHSNINYLRDVMKWSAKCRRFIFISSTSVYGQQPVGDITESQEGVNVNVYGMTKLIGEKLLEEAGLPVICLRCPAILELQNKNNFLSKVFLSCIKGNTITIANPNKPFNSFVSASQLAGFAVNLPELLPKFDVVNMAVKCQLTLKQVVELIRSELSSSSIIEYSKSDMSHYNLNISKAISYGLSPIEPEAMLMDWCKHRIDRGNTA